MTLLTTIRRLVRFGRLVATDRRLPRVVRYGLAVLLLIPGPVDELVALPAVIAVLIWRRAVIVDCWERSSR
jgi:hypothetical protein